MNIFRSTSAEETRKIAASFAKTLGHQAVLLLHGDLGAGKTCFVQGLAEGLGWEGVVTSPTYGLVQELGGTPPLVHADLYRLTEASQVWGLGLDEWMEDEAIVAVEWSERVQNFWPADAWQIELKAVAGHENARDICMWRERA
ncbi:tRNA (adenosine(37)-N6)-threonylcarbamoyltransferase complex ATPase subunit type 1 TsaE [Kiritimatiellota bacterium B12222]|nr:tRNA (adenosine(37)-N6)-threonylcarbamoyltransferase complex ATPase subunit type 1 TsaE [Kiritimatiellota bacterium B12222]